jgi:hypothetical protein
MSTDRPERESMFRPSNPISCEKELGSGLVIQYLSARCWRTIANVCLPVGMQAATSVQMLP